MLKMAVVVEVEMMMISSSKKCETSVAWCRLDTTMMPLFFFYAGYIGLRVILAPFMAPKDLGSHYLRNRIAGMVRLRTYLFWKDSKCVCRRRPSSSSVVVVRRRRPSSLSSSVPLEFPRKYISYIISKVSHVSTLDLMDFDR